MGAGNDRGVTESARLRASCLQYTPTDDARATAALAAGLARRAVAEGGELLLLPEYAGGLHGSGRAMRALARPEQEHPLLHEMRDIARESGTWVLIGSLATLVDDERLANRCVLVSGDGEVAGRYDKIHMFDATLPGGRTIRESGLYRSGQRAVVAPTPWGMIGLSICYDVRFPTLYRFLAQAGAVMLSVPSAFTAASGALHWHALLRARAIENCAFVLAPATCGEHPGGHRTYGHSLIVDPSGEIIADGGTEPGIVHADLDLGRVREARAAIPSWSLNQGWSVASAALRHEEGERIP